ncbi:OLC1v1031596C1 [Oldenlandia corymbosa var. corymbosa]|uniref:OLC1v1031596C1 n=1 Tax=Oldenlandia corymbosa var. corymbosa TaxID=529605 RepID=A0AAV1CM15_OLDCO|nr:OLC1v1031596C1 [Oldenlandia corymbosa var. corymbosa]
MGTPAFCLGFDPVVNSYKLLLVDQCRRRDKCQILTIGKDSTWRDIDRTPVDIEFYGRGNYSEGALYWNNHNVIVAFDLVQEKFQSLAVKPNVMHSLESFGPMAVLSGGEFIIRYNYKTRSSPASGEMGAAKKETWSDLQVIRCGNYRHFPTGLFPDGKILLHDHLAGRYYLFDPIDKETKMIVMENPALSLQHI